MERRLLIFGKSWYASSDPDLVYFLSSDNLKMAYDSAQRYLRGIGVKSKFTDPNKSSSNGIVERLIGTLDKIQRVLRIQRCFPDEFWGPAFHHANFYGSGYRTHIREKVDLTRTHRFLARRSTTPSLKVSGLHAGQR